MCSPIRKREEGDEKGEIIPAWADEVRREGEAYGPSVHVKTWEKPQDRTWASDSLREGAAITFGLEWEWEWEGRCGGFGGSWEERAWSGVRTRS